MKIERLFKLLSDNKRLRILMLLNERELCVCQLMAVIGTSQPLISRSLSLLSMAGFLDTRREGKLIFYKIKRNLPSQMSEVLLALRRIFKDDSGFRRDLKSLKECREFQKKTGLCGMKGFLAFMKMKGRK